jgi:hypothetical protein
MGATGGEVFGGNKSAVVGFLGFSKVRRTLPCLQWRSSSALLMAIKSGRAEGADNFGRAAAGVHVSLCDHRLRDLHHRCVSPVLISLACGCAAAAVKARTDR